MQTFSFLFPKRWTIRFGGGGGGEEVVTSTKHVFFSDEFAVREYFLNLLWNYWNYCEFIIIIVLNSFQTIYIQGRSKPLKIGGHGRASKARAF